MATWKVKIKYGGTTLYDGVTNEVAWSKHLPTSTKLMSGDIDVEYYKKI